MIGQHPPRNRAERRAAARGRGRASGRRGPHRGERALAMTAGVIGSAPAADAAGTYTVTAATDDGTGDPGTLSEAIGLANADPNSVINFDVAGGAISITGTMPKLTAPMSITGPGATALTIDANDAHRIFYIDSSASAVTISGLTLADASDEGSSVDGAAILSRSSLVLSASVITGSTADSDGAGLYIGTEGTLQVTDTTFSGNSANVDDGGAIRDPERGERHHHQQHVHWQHRGWCRWCALHR